MSNPNKPEELKVSSQWCDIPGCLEFKVKTICQRHKARIERTGRLDLRSQVQRIFCRVKVNGDCFEYTGSLNEHGYGRIKLNGKRVLAHRAVYNAFAKETAHPKLQVCHTCDNRACVRPDHLFLATNKMNFDDAVRKGRIDPVRRAKDRWKKCPTFRKN